MVVHASCKNVQQTHSQIHQQTSLLLHDHGADPTLQNTHGLTPLAYAAHYGHPSLVSLLLAWRGQGRKDDGGRSLDTSTIIPAAEHEHKDEESSSSSSPSSIINPAEHEGEGSSSNSNSSSMDAPDKMGATALHHAAQGGHIAVLRLLLSSSSSSSSSAAAAADGAGAEGREGRRFDIEARTLSGRTALQASDVIVFVVWVVGGG